MSSNSQVSDQIERLALAGFLAPTGDKLVQMVQLCFDNYREYREAIVWVFKNLREKPWFEKAGISYEKQLITLVHVLDITFREIENHRDTTENRKINKQAQTVLFKDGILDNFISISDVDTITRIYTLVDDVKDLDPAIKMRMRNKILDKHPSFKFFGTEEKTVVLHGRPW